MRNLALGVTLAAIGCSDGSEVDEGLLTGATQEARADNGLGANGLQWNGLQWNGLQWNGIGWNGLQWNGLGWNGLQWNGIGWNGLQWNGSAWNGLQWNGLQWNGLQWNGVPGQDSPTFTTLHNWINHSDVDGDGTPSASRINKCGPTTRIGPTYSSAYLNSDNEMMARVQALAYWTSCACPSTVEIPFADTHGRYSTTLYGGLGLAPTWCGSDVNAVVPEDEIELVSACLLARVNITGRHFPLSLRSLESGTAYTANEYISHRKAVAWYWGNLWKQPHTDNDTTTLPYNASSSTTSCALGQAGSPTSCNNLGAAGGTWWNQERFVAFGAADNSDYGNQAVYGRVCDAGNEACQGQLSFLGPYTTTKKRLGEAGAWDAASPTTNYYKGVAPLAGDPAAAGGFSYLYLPTHTGGGSKVKEVYYRGRSWRVMQVYFPYIVGFEDPVSTAPPYHPELLMWSQIESGSLTISSDSNNQVVLCPQGECQGRQQNSLGQWEGRKLVKINSSQTLTVNLTGNLGAGYPTGDASEPMTVAIRYSRAGLLGPGQCNPATGCAGTVAADCASGVLGAGDSGCAGGIASPGRLRVWVKSNRIMAPATEWNEVHGGSSPYGKNIFPPTVQDSSYATAYIYPVYMQDSASTIPGRTDMTSGVTYDTVRLKVQGETGVPVTDAPHLDAAYFFPGAPSSDADCKGIHGCWLFAGPRVGLSLAQNTQYTYQSPPLPAGSYTFKIINMTNDGDLYVKANSAPTLSSYDCAPQVRGSGSETCTVNLTGRGGRIHVMVRGYSATSASMTLVGHN